MAAKAVHPVISLINLIKIVYSVYEDVMEIVIKPMLPNVIIVLLVPIKHPTMVTILSVFHVLLAVQIAHPTLTVNPVSLDTP
jgi:hypothetical protein